MFKIHFIQKQFPGQLGLKCSDEIKPLHYKPRLFLLVWCVFWNSLTLIVKRFCFCLGILCLSLGTQECKMLKSSTVIPSTEDHSFSTRLSGQLSLSVAPYSHLFFPFFFQILLCHWSILCYCVFTCILSSAWQAHSTHLASISVYIYVYVSFTVV